MKEIHFSELEQRDSQLESQITLARQQSIALDSDVFVMSNNSTSEDQSSHNQSSIDLHRISASFREEQMPDKFDRSEDQCSIELFDKNHVEEIQIDPYSGRHSNADSIVAISIKKPSRRSPTKSNFCSPEKRCVKGSKSPTKNHQKTPAKTMFPLQELSNAQ